MHIAVVPVGRRVQIEFAPKVDPSLGTARSMGLAGIVWRLPRRQRQVIALRVIADLSEDETGRILGISSKTVSVHLHRGLATLRSGIGAASSEEDTWKIQTSPIK